MILVPSLCGLWSILTLSLSVFIPDVPQKKWFSFLLFEWMTHILICPGSFFCIFHLLVILPLQTKTIYFQMKSCVSSLRDQHKYSNPEKLHTFTIVGHVAKVYLFSESLFNYFSKKNLKIYFPVWEGQFVQLTLFPCYKYALQIHEGFSWNK